jgi:hypothetical protein
MGQKAWLSTSSACDLRNIASRLKVFRLTEVMRWQNRPNGPCSSYEMDALQDTLLFLTMGTRLPCASSRLRYLEIPHPSLTLLRVATHSSGGAPLERLAPRRAG